MTRIDRSAIQHFSAIAEKLATVFADVTMYGVRPPLSVTAKQHTGKWARPTCVEDHHAGHLLRVTNVTVPITKGFLGGDPETAWHWDEIIYCSRCEQVIHIK